MKSIKKIIEKEINKNQGKPFSVRGLSKYGSDTAVRKALQRLSESGQIEQVARGVYYMPKINKYIGKTVPSIEQIVSAVAESTAETVSVTGAHAALELGLTTQVPLKPIFYTSGTTRKIKAGSNEVLLKHVCPRKLKYSHQLIGKVILALGYIGSKHATIQHIAAIQEKLPHNEFNRLVKNSHLMPVWMQMLFTQYVNSHNVLTYG
ncbi:MAG: type IV toxin-antitoxin system AbiEi family antitoxin domain-containing protein [Candidatus Margulisbacteria bacterium]|nr:type IV toxin-antitoxin system AbiEi family antitoxin domain-containing protein [Candidatus Margulisiibacteriota bacterium]